MNNEHKEVAVVGAGPYGLSIAANLCAEGIEPYAIGRPMEFWKTRMPAGMYLRSGIEASNIHARRRRLSLGSYQKETRKTLEEPLPIADFIAYGEWFQKQVAPDLDTRYVRRITEGGNGFCLTMEDGEPLAATAVVLALGIGAFAYRPEQFQTLPPELAPHSSAVADPARYRGRRVAVVGKGQSALEHAALLHENGADVVILTRGAKLNYLGPRSWRRQLLRKVMPGPLKPLSHWLRPPTDLGSRWTARTIAYPEKFRRRSAEVQESLLDEVQRPIGAEWLRSRLDGVAVRYGITVDRAGATGERLCLELSDGTIEHVDAAVLATGYRIDLSRYPILDDSLRRRIEGTRHGYPVLGPGLETSVRGLFMAGVVGERTLGPTLRFVTGTSNAGPRVAAAVAARVRQEEPSLAKSRPRSRPQPA